MSGIIAWFTANWGMIMGIIGTGGGIAGFIKSFHIVREYERAVITGPRGNIVRDKETGNVKEYRGVLIRLAGLYRVAVVNIRDRMDLILIDGVMRPTAEDKPAKCQLAATCKWNVQEGKVYEGCEWQVDDLGEFARGMFQKAIQEYLEKTPMTTEPDTDRIFAACEPRIREELLEHGVVWTKLMVNKNALADAEIQARAIRQIGSGLLPNPGTP